MSTQKTVRSILAMLIAGWVALQGREAWAILYAAVDTDAWIDKGKPEERRSLKRPRDSGLFYAYVPGTVSHLPGVPYNSGIRAWGRAEIAGIPKPWPLSGYWLFVDDADMQTDWFLGHNPKSGGAKADCWWGSQFIVDGPPGELVELQMTIPALRDITLRLLPEDVPAQGLYADGPLSAQFNILCDLVVAHQATTLFAGSGELGGPEASAPGLVAAGDLADAGMWTVTDTVSPDGQARKRAVLARDIQSPVVRVPTNTVFEAHTAVSMQSYERLPEEGQVWGTAGSLAVAFGLTDAFRTADYSLRAVPEPATLALLGVGVLALAGCRRRPSRSGHPRA